MSTAKNCWKDMKNLLGTTYMVDIDAKSKHYGTRYLLKQVPGEL
jgi:hypothetical protein